MNCAVARRCCGFLKIPKDLSKAKEKNGNSALALVCMEGHLEIVQLLCNHGAGLDSVNELGRTPIMEALSFGRGAVALYLAKVGASLITKDNAGKSILDMAKATLKELEENEWLFSRDENETPAKRLDREENRENFLEITGLCKDRLRILKDTGMASSRALRGNGGVTFVQSGIGRASKISVQLNTFTTRLANEGKAFAHLSRGSPHEDVYAISGYTPGGFGGSDECLDRREWMAKAFIFSKVVGHELAVRPEEDGGVPGRYNACHAEKQVMAYFLWKHTTLCCDVADVEYYAKREEVGMEDEEEEENLRICEEEKIAKLGFQQASAPSQLQAKTEILVGLYVTTSSA